MLIGYARVSTAEQNEERQRKALTEQGVQKIYIDKQSGKNIDRAAFKEMMSFARQGDIIITESISRIARNTRDLLKVVEDLTSNGIEFKSLKENIDTTTPQGKFVLTIFAAMAELERDQILQRQAEGIAIAKEQGKYTGKPKKSIDETKFRAVCERWKKGEITARAAMNELQLKPNTFYRRVKELGIE